MNETQSMLIARTMMVLNKGFDLMSSHQQAEVAQAVFDKMKLRIEAPQRLKEFNVQHTKDIAECDRAMSRRDAEKKKEKLRKDAEIAAETKAKIASDLDAIVKMISDRKSAIDSGDVEAATKIEFDLLSKGIALIDKPDGSTDWHHVENDEEIDQPKIVE